MPRVVVLFAAALLLLGPRAGSAQSPPTPPTVDELIAKNLEARGGLDKLKAVQTLKMTARMNSRGADLVMTTYARRPNLTRKEMAMGSEKMIFVFDGSEAWSVNPIQGSPDPVAITGPDLDVIKKESDFDSPFVDYQTRGYTITLVGTETTTAGRRAHHLKVTRAGTSVEVYLDAETGLEAKTVTTSPMGALEQEFLDYRDVQGIKMPFAVRTLQNGVKVSDIKIDAIQFNGPLDDAIFRKPVR